MGAQKRLSGRWLSCTITLQRNTSSRMLLVCASRSVRPGSNSTLRLGCNQDFREKSHRSSVGNELGSLSLQGGPRILPFCVFLLFSLWSRFTYIPSLLSHILV